MRKRSDYLARMAYRGSDAIGWYANATREISLIAFREGWSHQRFASVLAITSPRVKVSRNVSIALYYCHHGHLDNISVVPNVRRSLDHWEATGIVRGPKVSAFRNALCGDPDAVVLDVHMAAVFDVPQSQFSRPSVYARCRS